MTTPQMWEFEFFLRTARLIYNEGVVWWWESHRIYGRL